MTVEDLYRFAGNGQVELVGGKLFVLPHAGDLPDRVAGTIYLRLREYEVSAEAGRTYSATVVFLVNLPNRQSFSPDVAFYVGPKFRGKFLQGAPVFAAEVRGESDYGEIAEREMAEKRDQYFAAGTKVVWDIDVLREEIVRVFRASEPTSPTIFRRGERAEAEPTLPGFQVAVDDLFE
ncbi:MAG: Uma2 family endonuclease [Vicinamibacteria bacterium]